MNKVDEGTLLWLQGESDRDKNTAWSDKYRPRTLAQVALAPDQRRQFEVLLTDGLTHDLVLTGLPGTGKTSVANVIAQQLFPTNQHGHVLRVSSTQSGNVDFIRNEVIGWMRSSAIVVICQVQTPIF